MRDVTGSNAVAEPFAEVRTDSQKYTACRDAYSLKRRDSICHMYILCLVFRANEVDKSRETQRRENISWQWTLLWGNVCSNVFIHVTKYEIDFGMCDFKIEGIIMRVFWKFVNKTERDKFTN